MYVADNNGGVGCVAMATASRLPVYPVAPRHTDGIPLQSVVIPAESPGALSTSTNLTRVPVCF